jgi:hypothetical protein
VFNATFNNISVISWRSVFLVEETGVPGKNHPPAVSHWQTLSHNDGSITPHHHRDSNSQYICSMCHKKSVFIICLTQPLVVEVSVPGKWAATSCVLGISIRISCLFLRFFYWSLELFGQCGIFDFNIVGYPHSYLCFGMKLFRAR